jgi:hypothetical protein
MRLMKQQFGWTFLVANVSLKRVKRRLVFFKFQNFWKNPENRAGSGSGFPISGLYRDPEIAKMAIFGIKIVGISRFRDPEFGIPSTLILTILT